MIYNSVWETKIFQITVGYNKMRQKCNGVQNNVKILNQTENNKLVEIKVLRKN